MGKKLTYILILFCLVACSSGDSCMQDLNFSMKAEIYRMVFDNSTEQFVTEKYPISVTMSGLERDSLIYDSYSTSTLSFPLKKLDSISSFLFTTELKVDTGSIICIDTIDVHHINTEEFISLECGCIVKNSIVGIAHTTNRIDSIVVVSPEVNLQSTNNIKIYLNQK